MDLKNGASDTFVAVAHVASELFKAQSIAEELSITSKNARALAVRAGSTAAGFNEITRFIEGLSKLTIEAANQVNLVAISQTKYAADLYRAQIFKTRLDRVQYSPPHLSDNELQPIYDRVNHNIQKFEQQITLNLRDLAVQLSEVKMELRASQVVSVVSRVEASRAHEDFRESLNAVADKVASAGQRINDHLVNARKHLSYLHI